MGQFRNTSLILMSLLLCSCFTEAAISAWTDENSSNGPTFTVTPAENIADTVNVIILTATSNVPITSYTIDSQTNADQFEVMKVLETGEVSLKAGQSLDCEAGTSVVVEIKAVDGDSTSTATVSITVTEVNEHIPEFTAPASATHVVCVEDGSAAPTLVYTVAAADADCTENTTKYAIASGSTDVDFVIDEDTGAITVANTLSKARTAGYCLSITATDAGTDPGTKVGTVTIFVVFNGCCCGSENGVGSVSVSIAALMTTLILSIYNVI